MKTEEKELKAKWEAHNEYNYNGFVNFVFILASLLAGSIGGGILWIITCLIRDGR